VVVGRVKLPAPLRDAYPFAAPPGHKASGGEGWSELRTIGSLVGDRKAVSPARHAAWMRTVMAVLGKVKIEVKR
jgi:hypothetical protein